MPRELMGMWASETPNYEDRYLELASAEVGFGIGGESFTRHDVVEVRRVEHLDRIGYRITYLSAEGLEHFLSLQYDAVDAQLSLTHQPQVVWRRVEAFTR